MPSLVRESLWQTPQASTLTLTQPLPGSGICCSFNSKPPPALITLALFMIKPLRYRPYRYILVVSIQMTRKSASTMTMFWRELLGLTDKPFLKIYRTVWPTETNSKNRLASRRNSDSVP
jgi:hypothetical protein